MAMHLQGLTVVGNGNICSAQVCWKGAGGNVGYAMMMLMWNPGFPSGRRVLLINKARRGGMPPYPVGIVLFYPKAEWFN